MSLYERVSQHCVLGLTLLLGMAAWAQADTTNYYWTGSGGDGNWFNAANWNPSANWPQDGDTVVVTSGSVLLTNSTANLMSFTPALLVNSPFMAKFRPPFCA